MKQLSAQDGYLLSLGSRARKRRLQKALVPEGAWLPIDIDLIEVIAELDPGMVDWNQSPQVAWA